MKNFTLSFIFFIAISLLSPTVVFSGSDNDSSSDYSDNNDSDNSDSNDDYDESGSDPDSVSPLKEVVDKLKAIKLQLIINFKFESNERTLQQVTETFLSMLKYLLN